jgi:hypothetical protein
MNTQRQRVFGSISCVMNRDENIVAVLKDYVLLCFPGQKALNQMVIARRFRAQT